MRRRSNAGKLILGIVIAVLAIAGLIYFGYVFFQAEVVEVEGNGKYTDIYIEGLADIEPETHMLMLDTDKIKQNIEEAEPYLEVLSVKKKIPKTVVIEVKERQPKALISYSDSYLLADGSANVLEILDALPEERLYPIIEGLTISAVSLGRQVGTEDTFKITVMGEILTALENRQLTDSIKSIDLSDINNIRMTSAEDLAIKFGQADKIVDKVKWIDKMLPTLKKDGRTSGVLDVSMGTFATYRMDESESSPVTTYDEQGQGNTTGQDGLETTSGTSEQPEGGDGSSEDPQETGDNTGGSGESTPTPGE